MIDTHAHLESTHYNIDREAVIKRSFDNGVEKIINIGTSLQGSYESIDLANSYKNIFASVGIFPEEQKKIDNDFKKKFEDLARMKKVVAIGECGLDYVIFKKEKTFEHQKELFRFQLEIAQKLNLPVIIHGRDSYSDIFEIVKSFTFSERSGVIHCYLENWETAQKFLDLGFNISFTGAITYKKKEEVSEVIKKMPLDRMMVETDCPYLTPQVFRGQRNEPMYVKYVIEKIAEIRNLSFEEVEKATNENAIKLFEI
ncbi:MAG: TatD family hydrolase [Patescibacteria group bacterium]|nr:TatD family hydrolase [Patescibacteria group bacterium]